MTSPRAFSLPRQRPRIKGQCSRVCYLRHGLASSLTIGENRSLSLCTTSEKSRNILSWLHSARVWGGDGQGALLTMWTGVEQ